MSRIRSKDTKPEIKLRRQLTKESIKGYKIHYKLTGKPDIVFPRRKIAIFIDGCFWHKCPKCFIKPRSNKPFWKKKINQNLKRDKKVNKTLKKQGWKVIRIWEHELKTDVGKCTNKIKKAIL